MFAFLKNIGPTELIVIGIILILFFGGRKLSELGRSIRDSKKELLNIKDELQSSTKSKDSKK